MRLRQYDGYLYEEDVYDPQLRSLLVEDDVMSPEEDGFMQGYMDAEQGVEG